MPSRLWGQGGAQLVEETHSSIEALKASCDGVQRVEGLRMGKLWEGLDKSYSCLD
jgi:hypothetical protein